MLIEEQKLRKLYLEEEKTTTEIAKLLGLKSKSAIGYWLKKYGIPTRKTGGTTNFDDLTGRTFGRLTVLQRVKTKTAGDTKWVCHCECGKSTVVGRNALVGELTRSCGCLRHEKQWKGCGELSATYWNRVIKGAKKRKLEVSASIEDAWSLYLEQNRRCALTGMPIEIVTDYTRNHSSHTASLDRIDNSKGYTKENIQWVHRDINIMRNNWSVEMFVFHCRKVVEHYDRTRTS